MYDIVQPTLPLNAQLYFVQDFLLTVFAKYDLYLQW